MRALRDVYDQMIQAHSAGALTADELRPVAARIEAGIEEGGNRRQRRAIAALRARERARRRRTLAQARREASRT